MIGSFIITKLSTRLFRRERPDASKRISDNEQKLLNFWLEQTRREVPGASTLDEKDLINCMPEFLQTLAAVVSTSTSTQNGERTSIEILRAATEHGTARAAQPAYTLDQVITEYRILRQLLLAFLNVTGSIKAREQEKLLEAIDYGIMEASVQFTAALGFNRARASAVEMAGLKQELLKLHENVEMVSSERNRARDDSDRARQETDQLAKAMSEIQTERDMRERFVSAMTHDLRTPMTAALMRAELIAKEPNNPDRVRNLSAQLAFDIQRTDKMIRNLLDANRIRAGEPLHLNKSLINLNHLAERVLEEQCVMHGDRFILDAPQEIEVFVDVDGIRRIIENLCQNAIKYGDKQAKVRVRLRNQGPQVSIAIHNEGTPLSTDEQKTLFEPFRRTVSAKTGLKKGWGLGLTLVKGMAESHGGTVQVESAENKGTTFLVLLPNDSRRFTKAS